MASSPASRDWTMKKIPRKAATTYTAGDFIYNDGTDNVPVTTTTQGNQIGIVVKSYDSSTSTEDMYVLCPTSPFSTFYADVTGTLTKDMEGDQFDWADAASVDQATSTYDAVTLDKFTSSSKGIFRLNYTFGIEN